MTKTEKHEIQKQLWLKACRQANVNPNTIVKKIKLRKP